MFVRARARDAQTLSSASSTMGPHAERSTGYVAMVGRLLWSGSHL